MVNYWGLPVLQNPPSEFTPVKEHAEDQYKQNCSSVLLNLVDTKENLYDITVVMA